MIRTFAISIFSLALVGGAQAAEVIKVSLNGKTEAAIKAELQAAAREVCGARAAIDYDACVQSSYSDALNQLGKLKAAKLASVVF